ncbi:MAG: twin-arginine translocase TatA/TatE family subunit [Gammaproteobacteria bacterium]|nr:twin-arginine translocase TatA/TatE family subunit [Gammaproteobacteria bacterium]MCY4165882.1 twin-arginine translocase TatA/TatE family subunit [Gammaproteobacteria bacterium]MCY4256186.1 twin-arginine translocase TatA/TatE family subunit [Gammaproteobacteria bacterium]MCY4339989.1 twin-arginine translocase TatA/TatE family subunit [Gammaproteobacteria bacterium]
MGIGGISGWQLLIVLLLALVIFGTKRIRNLGSDLGSAIKGFRKAVSDPEKSDPGQLGRADAEFSETEAGAETTKKEAPKA